ncbi:hypothetical protein D3Y57_17720 [Sphingomonas paeninsulae]|uniref:General stress protein 17M-like domain-containing protein n=1 Tax=Sphingomonas paeninsulae TaxID=2319844 RepID=A0A494TDW4_SPHPE|nr:general stress protein [Sphingomonas paeninsulae]AYJ87430.1 hypothetical protein D3Y57_17720 [Sphingomonas paeninsulae]
MSKTVTRLFDNYSDATNAVRELESLGVPHDHISIVANNAHGEHGGHDHNGVNDHGDVSRGTSTGAAVGGVGGLLAGLGLLAIPGLGPIVAAGWLAATAVGAGIGAAGGAATGSIVGALKNAGHTDEEAHVYSEGVRRGGSLVSAKVEDAQAAEAEAILHRNKSVDVATRGAAYRNGGWSSFDETAPAYTTEEIERERVTYSGSTRI